MKKNFEDGIQGGGSENNSQNYEFFDPETLSATIRIFDRGVESIITLPIDRLDFILNHDTVKNFEFEGVSTSDDDSDPKITFKDESGRQLRMPHDQVLVKIRGKNQNDLYTLFKLE